MGIGLYYMKTLLAFPVKLYFSKVIGPVILFLCIILPLLWVGCERLAPSTLLWISSLYVCICGGMVAFFVVLNKNERVQLRKMILRR